MKKIQIKGEKTLIHFTKNAFDKWLVLEKTHQNYFLELYKGERMKTIYQSRPRDDGTMHTAPGGSAQE